MTLCTTLTYSNNLLPWSNSSLQMLKLNTLGKNAIGLLAEYPLELTLKLFTRERTSSSVRETLAGFGAPFPHYIFPQMLRKKDFFVDEFSACPE